MTDPIADMLIRIKNALMAGRKEVLIPHSKVKEALAKLLADHQYVESYELVEKQPQNDIKIVLRYVDAASAISGVKRISKPGRRVYVTADKIPVTLNGYGLTILSTNQGVIDDKTARQKQVGGEVMCQIW